MKFIIINVINETIYNTIIKENSSKKEKYRRLSIIMFFKSFFHILNTNRYVSLKHQIIPYIDFYYTKHFIYMYI